MDDFSGINWPALMHGIDGDGLDILLAVSPENFFYVTDTLLLSQKIIPSRLAMALLPRQTPPAVLVCDCERQQTLEDSRIRDIRTYLEFQDSPVHALAQLLEERDLGSGRIGIEKRFLAACHIEQLAALLPEAQLVGADHLFDAARAVKTPAEIEIMTEAATATEQAVLSAFRAAGAGDTEKKVADDLSVRLIHAGAASIFMTLAVGTNTAINHPVPGSRQLARGEILRADLGGVFRGYHSDLARPAVVATATGEQRSVYQRLREAQRETIDAARPGARACDLFDTCKRAFEQRGLSFFSQAVGHGLGIGLHEFPVLEAAERAKLKPGMVLNIEPMAKDAQGFLYHLEDILVVTEQQPQILTTVMATQELFIIR